MLRAAEGGGTAAARADRVRRASKVRVIHVGKTGGATARRYLGYAKQIHLSLVKQDKVRLPARSTGWPLAHRLSLTRRPDKRHSLTYTLARSQLIEWLQSDDIVAFVTVRDPVERVKSAYNWRKYKCYDTEDKCFSPLEPIFYNCYTTLNAFSEGSCDGSLCGDGWDETRAHLEHLESLVLPARIIRTKVPVHSCEEARSSMMSIDRAVCTWWPPRNSGPECDRMLTLPAGC